MTSPAENPTPQPVKAICSGDADSPHPRVYLARNTKGQIVCPYCGQRFDAANESSPSSTH